MVNELEKKVELETIPVELFSFRNNRTTDLINNQSEENSLVGRLRDYNFEFVEPIYIKSITVHTDGYNDFSTLQFSIFRNDGEVAQTIIDFSDGLFSIDVGQFANGFVFRPSVSHSYFSPKKINKIIVTGYRREQFSELEKGFVSLENFETRIVAKEASLDQRASEFEDSITSLNEEIEDLEKKRDALYVNSADIEEGLKTSNSELSEQKRLLTDLGEQVNDRQSEKGTLDSGLRKLRESVSSTTAQLNEIESKVRLFPSEISGFVLEGNRGIRVYIALLLPFIGIICWVVYSLFASAVDLTILYKSEDEIDIWTVFLTRIPFVVVAIAILEVCGAISSQFVFEIIQISKQRLNLSKIAIIAKDVSTASAFEQGFSKEELFELQTSAKMELLREHMQAYVRSDYQYKGTLINRLLNRRKQAIQNGDELQDLTESVANNEGQGED